jgi:tetratricopeptide (TPR) repeat protein
MNDNFLVKRANAQDVQRVAVVFSSLNANGFSYYNLFEAQEEKVHRIYIKDPHDQWYDRGISKEINNWAAVSSLIKEALSELGAPEVLTFGSSMGAYAAIRFACEIDAAACIAMSPQTLLDRRLPHTPKEAISEEGRDLGPLLGSWKPKNTTVFFGAADFVDIYNVLRVNWQGASLFPIANQDHLVGQYLASQRILLNLVQDFTNQGYFSVHSHLAKRKIDLDKNCFDPIQFGLISRVVEGYYLEAPWDLIPTLNALSALNLWADGLHIQARLLVEVGEFSDAIRFAGRARKYAPKSVTISDAYADILAQAGHIEESIIGFQRSLKLRAKHYGALCRLGELFCMVNRTEEAIEMLKIAVETRPRLNRAQKIAKKYALDLA